MEEANKVTFKYDGETVTLELTSEFKKSINLIENSNSSIFITGKAGTGKTSLLKYFRSQTKKKIAVVSFTGLAAINANGETIHSFFNFPIGFISPSQVKINELIRPMLCAIDTLVIDEVSMIRADLMDAIDKSLRIHRDVDSFFGGVQIIMIGDLYQLPPIIENDLKEIYGRYYNTPYFFSADVFSSIKLPFINLERIHRQTDPVFIEILNNIRERKNLPHTLNLINKNVSGDLTKISGDDTVIISTTNEKVRDINNLFLNRLKSEMFEFRAFITGQFEPKSFPTEETLRLKVGSKVMFIKNDPDHQYVNGDIGIITTLLPFSIEVKCKGSTLIVKKQKWEKLKYKYVPSEIEGQKGSIEKEVIGSFEQFPLRLGWAITVHKSQGQTYNKVYIDLHNGSFTSGQTYVALSRCKSLENLKLQRPITESDVILDHRIEYFKDVCENI